MLKKILSRVVSTIIVLIGVSIMSFLLVRLGGGDPARLVLPDTATEQEIEAQRVRMGLDQPYVVQYFTYVKGVVTGDLGYSYHFKMPISQLIAGRLPYTARLTMVALCFSLLLSIPLGESIYLQSSGHYWDSLYHRCGWACFSSCYSVLRCIGFPHRAPEELNI